MINNVEHIGIAVKDLSKSQPLFEKLLGTVPYKTEQVVSEGVTTIFFMSGGTKIELLEASKPSSPIAKFIEKRGEGLHHIALKVNNIKEEIIRLEKEGFSFINKEPHNGADNKLVSFIHPKSANGILIELCQEVNDKGGILE